MTLLLNVVYLLLLAVASPWLFYVSLRHGKYREGYAAKLWGHVPRRTGTRTCIWMHAVSVGEVNLLQTLVDRIGREFPESECVISTTTKTGYDLARRKYKSCAVFYCPLDFSWAVRRTFARLRPNLLILAELELWPNLIQAAHRAGVPVVVVNGRLSEKSYRGYRRLQPLVRNMLRRIALIAAQTEEYAERFRALGAPAEIVQVTGSLKFDGAPTARANPLTQQLAALAGIATDDVVLLAGSTQEPEEKLALQTFSTLESRFPQLRLILVPRHPERWDHVARMLDDSGVPWQRRSMLDSTRPATVSGAAPRILLVDTVGELGGWWGTAHIAFVGGSLGKRGGQNMIEPAAYGAAVAFGPDTRNFRDIVGMLLHAQAACVVHNGAELTAFVRKCLEHPAWANELGQHAQALVLRQRGATDRTLQLISAVAQRMFMSQLTPPAAGI